jgi:hypothetical protein
VNAELRQNPLGVVPRRVSADVQRRGDRGVGPALCQQGRDFHFTRRKTVPHLQVRHAALGGPIPAIAAFAALLLKVSAKFSHLSQGFPDLLDQNLPVLSQVGESREEVGQPIP